MSESSTGSAPRNPELLGVYCNDHLAAAGGGIELVSRMISRWRGTRFEQPLVQLRDELREEQAGLRSTMGALGLPLRQYKQVGVWLGEKLSRVKLNGRLLSRSPLSDLIEFEFIAIAVLAKRAGFETLRELAAVDRRIDARLFERLIEQADDQHSWLIDARREVAAQVFGGEPDVASDAADT